jgi:hypothetical protein
MKRSRFTAISLALAMLIVSAALASSASATTPAWIAEGSPLGTGVTAEIAESTTVKEAFSIRTNAAGVMLKVECTQMSVPKSLIEGESTRKDPSLTMGNCALTTGPHTCSVPSTITLEPLSSTLEGTAGSFKLKFTPTLSTTVMTITLSGAECILAGSFPVKGTMSCNYPGVETEGKNHVLEFSLTSGTELVHGTDKVTLTGKDEFWLKSGKNWKVA